MQYYENRQEDKHSYRLTNWATLTCCLTNLQKASTVKFKAASFSCKNNTNIRETEMVYKRVPGIKK